MKNLWNDKEASVFLDNPLSVRVYSSRLLGKEPALVLHGGGNTSVKAVVKNLFGNEEQILYVKGSGWDLATIETEGFPGVRLDILKRLAQLDVLSDSDMVREQRSAMLDPTAPSPSVEAILHAIIPFQFVDHTHADAVVTITNTRDGVERIQEIYGDRVLVIPYVMPGFVLAKKVYELTQSANWTQLEGMVLMNHGVFSFADDAKTSYERMIKIVSDAEEYLVKNHATYDDTPTSAELNRTDLLLLAELRNRASEQYGTPVVARLDQSSEAINFSRRADVTEIATRGPLTPDHVIRTKRIPMIMTDNPQQAIHGYAGEYQKYFEQYTNGQLHCLDKSPRWVIWPGRGVVSLGARVKDADIINDITKHTIRAIQAGEKLGGWQALGAGDIFEVEYWELEQAKLKKTGTAPVLQGKVALVTGAASGIGKACLEALNRQGAAVIALDINAEIETLFPQSDVLGIPCDVTDPAAVAKAIARGISEFAGLDILVTNAGIFPASETIATMSEETWDKSIALNLTSHQRLLKECIPFLRKGIDPTIIFIASKNVPAPGPGASAYSCAKAGLTQLARIAALELAADGIRVNTLHPDAVFDTAIWTNEVLEKRAKHYGLSVQEYKTKNLLRIEVTSEDVANLVCALAGPIFAKTTGAQIAIDGGNDRVI